MSNEINKIQGEEKELLEEIFFNKLKVVNNSKEKNFNDFLEKTYIRIKLKKLFLTDGINLFLKKLEDFENYRKDLKNLAKEREDLKIKVMHNLKLLNEKLKELYSLMLIEEDSKPIIIEEKAKKHKSNYVNKGIPRKSTEKGLIISDTNVTKETATPKQNNLELAGLDEEKILKKLEEELKNLEKELQIATM